MAYSVPDLPYAYDALEPHIDEATMRVHHDKHHQAYVDKANGALEGTEWADKDVEDVLKNLSSLPADKQGPVRNNAGGHYNHSLFWKMMSPDGGGEPSGELADAINSAFGSFDAFKEEFKNAGIGQFGSGWAWLVKNSDGSVAVAKTAEPGRADLRRPDRRCSAPTSGSTPTTSSTRTNVPNTSTPSGTSSTGTTWRSASRRKRYADAGCAASERRGSASPPLGGISLIACSARAVMVRLGLTPTLAGTAAPSQTSRFS